MQYKRSVLSNGLRVLTIPMPSFESATAMVMVGAGSRYENRKNSGISHFLEHMAFKGTKKYPTAMDIASLIDGIGGEFNAFTGKETTAYYVKSAANNVGISLDVLADMLQSSLLDAKEIEKEKGVILEEINLYEDTPARKIGDVLEQLLYGDTPMGWDIAGDKEVIKKITREDFSNYLASLYSASNITVVVAGGIDEKQTVKIIEEKFGKMSRFDTQNHNKVVEGQKDPAVKIRHKKTEQVHISLGVRTVGIDSNDRYALSVLSAILGGGMSSRLFHEVREKRGLGYYVRTYSEHYVDCGNLASTAGVDPKRIDEAISVMVEEYQKLGNGIKNVKDEELKKAKEFLKGHMVLELEDSRSVAAYYAGQELLEKTIDNPDEDLVKIDKVTLEQVASVAKRYLTKQPLNLAIIGDFEDKERFQKLLEG